MESKGASGMIIKKIQQNKSKMRKQKVNKKVNYQWINTWLQTDTNDYNPMDQDAPVDPQNLMALIWM